MECTTFELAEVLKKDRHKRGNVLCGLLCRALNNETRHLLFNDHERSTNDSLAVLGIGEPDANRLVNKKDIGIRIPCLRVESRSIVIRYLARS